LSLFGSDKLFKLGKRVDVKGEEAWVGILSDHLRDERDGAEIAHVFVELSFVFSIEGDGLPFLGNWNDGSFGEINLVFTLEKVINTMRKVSLKSENLF
jgi:hypothetical protein